MRKIIAIGLVLLLVALSACTSYEKTQSTNNDNQNTIENSVGDPVLDTIGDAPEEVVDSQELDSLMDNISMDDW